MEHHAKYSPSKLPRILQCPGSLALTVNIEETQSEYAMEGTMLHKVTEQALLAQLTELSQTLIDKFSLVEEHVEAVNEILEFVQVLKMSHEQAPTLEVIEQQVSLAQYYSHNLSGYAALKDVYGTLDYCLHFKDTKTLYIIDWKYGKGVEVFPDSDQLKAYALGAMATVIPSEVENVVTIIGQPRLYSGEHFKEFNYKPEELTTWLHDILGPALVLAEQVYKIVHPGFGRPSLAQSQIDRLIKSGEIKLSPSATACLWCKIKMTCAARREAATEVAEEVFKVYAKLPDHTDPAEVTALLAKATDLRKYLTDLELYVMRQIQQGIDVPLYKMVAGRSLRKWLDEKEMLKYTKTLGYTQDDMSTKKIMSPAQAEKKVGVTVKKTKEFQALITKPPGKPTLVLKTDKRKALEYATATDKFAEFVKD